MLSGAARHCGDGDPHRLHRAQVRLVGELGPATSGGPRHGTGGARAAGQPGAAQGVRHQDGHVLRGRAACALDLAAPSPTTWRRLAGDPVLHQQASRGVASPASSTACAVPTLGYPTNGTSRRGLKMRMRNWRRPIAREHEGGLGRARPTCDRLHRGIVNPRSHRARPPAGLPAPTASEHRVAHNDGAWRCAVLAGGGRLECTSRVAAAFPSRTCRDPCRPVPARCPRLVLKFGGRPCPPRWDTIGPVGAKSARRRTARACWWWSRRCPG